MNKPLTYDLNNHQCTRIYEIYRYRRIIKQMYNEFLFIKQEKKPRD